MRCELPVLLRCCFCFPLRIGLLVWAYLKQIFTLCCLTIMIVRLCQYHGRTNVVSEVISSIIIIIFILDVVFHVLFIISAHTITVMDICIAVSEKDYQKMRIFYRYSIYVLCLNVVLMGLYLGMWCYYLYVAPIVIIFFFSIILPSLFMTLIATIFQGYLIILVRSEFLKLKNNSQFEFVNHATDEKCTANLDFVKGIPETV